MKRPAHLVAGSLLPSPGSGSDLSIAKRSVS